jgi:hypothetical protein
MISRLALVLATFLCFVVTSNAMASEPISINSKGITIGGFDTMSYHSEEGKEQHKAIKGKKDLSVEWNGAVWQFISEINRDAFLDDPERYRPAYGGYCANALSIGEGLIPTNGKTWEIFENQLYVFYAPRGRKRWNDGNWATYKIDADRAWQTIISN